MVDVITRFKLETTQYDSKLRDAAKGLSDYTKQAVTAGNEFGKFTQKNVEAARALGSITPSATNAKDKVKELVGAFNDVAKAYNVLTKEQQQSDFGRALADSMQTLKGRIADAKQEMNSTGSILDQLKDKFTVNIDALKLFNAGLTAAKAALGVAKDAFFASESNIDEWGRVVASSEAVYQGFLTSINNGDVSGFLGRIDQIVKAARDAYDALDALGSMKTIQGPAISAQQTENDRMRMMIQTGRYIAPIDGRKASMQNGQLLTPDQIHRLEQQLQGGMQKMVGLVGNEVKQTGKAIDAYYNSLAKQNGISLQEFRKGTSSWNEFNKRLQGAQAYRDYERQHTIYDDRTGIGHRDNTVNPYQQYANWSTFRVDKQGQNSLNDLVALIKQRDQQASQAYSLLSQSYRAINRAEGITVKNIMNGGSGGGGTHGGGGGTTKNPQTELQENQARINALTQEYVQISGEATQAVKERQEAIRNEISQLNERNNTLKLYTEQAQGKLLGNAGGRSIEIPVVPDVSSSLIPSIDKIREQMAKNPIVIPIEASVNDVKAITQAARTTAQVVSSIGQAFNSIEDPAAKVAGTIAMSIAQIALAYSQALAADKTLKTSIYGLIAGAAAAMVSMVTTISSIHSATGYAEGGIVKGNTYSMDQIPATLNAGEVVLNRAQAGNLAQQLQDTDGGRGSYKPSYVSGEQIWVALNRYTQRTGRGELVTWG